MNKLVILSRDHRQYRSLIESANPADLMILQSTGKIEEIENKADIDILLAEPDMGAELASNCDRLQWFQSTWAGVKPVLDLPSNNFLLTGVKDVFGKQMREYVFAYLLHFSRRIAEFTELQNNQKWLGSRLVTDNLFGKTLGIIGVGSIGSQVAKLAKQLDMQVLGITRNTNSCEYIDQYFHSEQLELFAGKLDYCVCLLPHTNLTTAMLNKKFFSSLPIHAIFINAGRAQVVDHKALISMLENNQLAGAVLDVFPEEPLAKDHTLWKTKNLIVTQHTSALSKPQDVVNIFLNNYNSFQLQTPLRYVVERNKGY